MTVGVVFLALAIVNILAFSRQIVVDHGEGSLPSGHSGRRTLSLLRHSETPPWKSIDNFIQPVTVKPKPDETSVYWHIPKSGGTNAKSYFGCLGLALGMFECAPCCTESWLADNVITFVSITHARGTVSKTGGLAKYGFAEEDRLEVFKPFENSNARFVNVDVTTTEGLDRAVKLGLVQSSIADVIFFTNPTIIEGLFDTEHKGRVISIFRNPVDRLISKFYYLSIASWEPNYQPSWDGMDPLVWAREHDTDHNFVMRTLMGKKSQHLTDADLPHAKKVLSERFIVGLSDSYEESIRRFEVVMLVDEKIDDYTRNQCNSEFFGSRIEKKNANDHPLVEPGSEIYNIIAENNSLDMALYEYIIELFAEQTELIDSYKT